MKKNRTTVSSMLEVCALFTIETLPTPTATRRSPRPNIYTLSVTPATHAHLVVDHILLTASKEIDHPLFSQDTSFGLDITYRDSVLSSTEVKLYWDPETQRYLQSNPQSGWLQIQ